MLRMKSHFSLISSQLLPKSQSLTLDCDFVFLIWQLIHSVHMAQLRNAPFGMSPRLAARSLSRTRRFFASASRLRCWVVMQGYEVRTCSAAPRFKTVTASLGHGFVPPTWKLIRSVHMIHEKRAFVLRDKSSFLSEACLRHGKRRCAPGRCFAEKYLRKCVARFPSHRAKQDPSRRLCRPFTSRLHDPSLCALRKLS